MPRKSLKRDLQVSLSQCLMNKQMPQEIINKIVRVAINNYLSVDDLISIRDEILIKENKDAK